MLNQKMVPYRCNACSLSTYHILKFGFGGVEVKGAHNSTELLGGDAAITVLIEQGECFSELSAKWISVSPNVLLKMALVETSSVLPSQETITSAICSSVS